MLAQNGLVAVVEIEHYDGVNQSKLVLVVGLPQCLVQSAQSRPSAVMVVDVIVLKWQLVGSKLVAWSLLEPII